MGSRRPIGSAATHTIGALLLLNVNFQEAARETSVTTYFTLVPCFFFLWLFKGLPGRPV